MKIRNDANGKKYLYDILDIKKAGVLHLASTQKGQLYGGENASAETSANKNVSQQENNVKRFSLKGTDNILKENERLKKQNDYLKSQMKLITEYRVNQNRLERFARKYIKHKQGNRPAFLIYHRRTYIEFLIIVFEIW